LSGETFIAVNCRKIHRRRGRKIELLSSAGKPRGIETQRKRWEQAQSRMGSRRGNVIKDDAILFLDQAEIANRILRGRRAKMAPARKEFP